MRYHCLGIDGMNPDRTGDWVRYADYLSLLQQLDEIRITLLQLRTPIAGYHDVSSKSSNY